MAAVTICSHFGTPKNKVCHCFHCCLQITSVCWPLPASGQDIRCRDLLSMSALSITKDQGKQKIEREAIQVRGSYSWWAYYSLASLPRKRGKLPCAVKLLQKLETTRNLDLVLKVKVLAAQLCLTLCDPMDCSPPGSSVHGILQTRILEWVAISFS